MAEDFSTADVQKLFYNKFVIVIGDSVMRGVYKDIIHFIQYDSHISGGDLKRKGEETCLGDELIEGGVRGELTNQTHYREIRQYKTDTVLIRFYFITQVYNKYFETIVEDLHHASSPQPDVIMMNSCLWDMSRYGPHWLSLYRDNLDKMLNAIKPVVKDSLFIWLTCMPVGKRARGGFLPRGIEWKAGTLRLDVLEANFFALQAVEFHGFDVVDLNYHFREFTRFRMNDDIHWAPQAHRRITCIVLGHICYAWKVPRPRRIQPLRNLEVQPLLAHGPNHRRAMTTPASFMNSYEIPARRIYNSDFVDNSNKCYYTDSNVSNFSQPFFEMDRNQFRTENFMGSENYNPSWGGNYAHEERPHKKHRSSRNSHIMRKKHRKRHSPY